MSETTQDAVDRWLEEDKIGVEDAQVIRTFSAVLSMIGGPSLTVLGMLSLTEEERDFCIPGYGHLDSACDYCVGMGV